MITVHHLNHSRSQRVLWLLEELAVPYEVRRYEREEGLRAPAALRAVHPLGKSPVITDGQHTIAESGAILEYLVDRYGAGRLRPTAGTTERLSYSYFMHYAEGSLMPILLLSLVFSRMPKAKLPFFVKPIVQRVADKGRQMLVTPELSRHLDFLESTLGTSTWFAGEELSAADVQMSYPTEAALLRGGLEPRWPKLDAFLQRIHARPAYQRALESGGPFEMLR